MSGNKDKEEITKMLKEEKENLLKEINFKIKKKKSLTNTEPDNEFLK